MMVTEGQMPIWHQDIRNHDDDVSPYNVGVKRYLALASGHQESQWLIAIIFTNGYSMSLIQLILHFSCPLVITDYLPKMN